MSELEENDYVVTWQSRISATDIESAANKAHDLLKGRNPLSLIIAAENEQGESDVCRFMPRAEECISGTLRRFLPHCEIHIEIDDEGVDIHVGSDYFRDIPNTADREAFVTAMFSSLPVEELNRMFTHCYTLDEWEDTLTENEEAAEE